MPASPQPLATPRLSRALLSPLAAPQRAAISLGDRVSPSTKPSPAEGSYAELLRRGPGPRPRATAAMRVRVPRTATTALVALVALAAVLALAALSRGAAPAAAPKAGAADRPAAPLFAPTTQYSAHAATSAAPLATVFATPFASDLHGVCPASPRAAATTQAPLTSNHSVALSRLAPPLSVGKAAAVAPMRRTTTLQVSSP